jgi:hypothetical protein
MRLCRVTNLRLALLLALILPLQAFAALSNCAQSAHWALPAAEAHCDHAHVNVPHHDCGTCCCVAAAGNPLVQWGAPRFTAPQLALVRIEPPPSVAIDRLDRPPRSDLT